MSSGAGYVQRGAMFLLAAVMAVTARAADDRIVVNSRALYPEGPLSDGAGGFYYTEMGADRVMHWDGAANRQVWTRTG